MNNSQERRPNDEDVEGHKRSRTADAEASGDDEDVEGHRASRY